MQGWLAQHPVGQQLREAFECGGYLCRAIAFLLQIPSSGSPRLEDVQWFVEYSGPVVFRKAVRNLVKLPEPEGPNWSQLRANSRAMLKECYLASTSGPATQTMEALEASLQKQMDVDLAPGCCDPLKERMSKLDSLEKQLRQGASSGLRKMACAMARTKTKQVLET